MIKTLKYRFRLKPSDEQEAKLVDFGAYSRGLWNLLLSENMRRYQYDKTFIFYKEMASIIKELKAFDEFSWLKAFDSAAAQQVARDLETAIKNSYDKSRHQRFPKFKLTYQKKKQHNDSFRAVNNSNCIKIIGGKISIPKVGKVPIVLHRSLASTIKTVTIKYSHGNWFASLTQEVDCKVQNENPKSITGFDINSQLTVVGSNGWYVKNPKSLKSSSKKLKQIQVQFSRRKKGSSGWHKSKARLNTIHGKITRQRLAFAHEVSCSIAKSSDIIVFEDLNVKGMQQFNGPMVGDNVMGMITELSKYKVQLNGGIYHEIGRYVKSSGICIECNHQHKFDLSVRDFSCENCGANQCRDFAAAKSIERTGQNDLEAAGIVVWGKPEAQKKSSVKTKVFENSELDVGTEKKEAA